MSDRRTRGEPFAIAIAGAGAMTAQWAASTAALAAGGLLVRILLLVGILAILAITTIAGGAVFRGLGATALHTRDGPMAVGR